MDHWEREELHSATFGMRKQVDQMLDVLAEQRARLDEIQQQLVTAQYTASSSDGLVEVTVDSAGVPTEVRFTKGALRNTVDQLGRSTTEAAREAARRAQEQVRQLVTPIAAAADVLPDLPDLMPGAPSLRGSRDGQGDSG
ncbi:YbaB/EbfC family nucleoid-associated protein [Nocardia sp. NPDC049220]|uniref:YbaB/EbfC family nucleoid-associated protein n=1 Tax=Nocardia sp. NPDC049220 TaxID=3155273 RepID=UPI0033E87029